MNLGVQRICHNGHQRTDDILGCPLEPYCAECGAPTTSRCESCKEPIRGPNHDSMVVSLVRTPVPNYCHNCGMPFPWTERRVDAAIALLDESESPLPEEKEKLRGALVAISSDTPQTALAVVRIKSILKRVGKPIGDAIYKIAVDVATEAAKKSLLGN
jgi:hypothetical protein